MIARRAAALASLRRRGGGESGASMASTGGENLEGGWVRSGGILPSFVRVSVWVASPPVSSAG